jgi:hypothetical protein
MLIDLTPDSTPVLVIEGQGVNQHTSITLTLWSHP